jgi:MFS family permease
MRNTLSFFLLLAICGALAIFSSTLAKTPVLPLFAQSLGAGPGQIGWIIMASTLPGILMSFPAGVLADRFGQRRLLIAALTIFASAPWLYLIVQSAWQLAAVRFYHGFATAVFSTVASATIAQRYHSDRAARLSSFSSATIIGRSLAPFLGGALLSLASIRSVYLACAVGGALALAVGLALREDGEHNETATGPVTISGPGLIASLRLVLRDRHIVAASLGEAAQYLTFGALEAFLVLYATAQGLPAWQIGVILGAQLLCIVVTKPLMGHLSDRIGRTQVILPGLLIGSLSLLVLPHSSSFPGLALLSLIYGIGFATVTSSTTALVADLTRNGAYGASLGVLATVMDIGQALGPVLTGWVVGAYGYTSAFTLLAAILLAGALLFSIGMRDTARPT